MRLNSRMRFAVGVPLIATGVFATTAVKTSPHAIATGAACAIQIADIVPLGSNPANIPVRFTEALGDSLSATVAEPAGVIVVSIARAANDGPMSAMMSLNTMRASAGTWDVSVRSERGECSGKVRIGAVSAANGPAKSLSNKPPKAAGHGECAAFMNDSIAVGLDRTEVTANYSEPIGSAISARLPKESGVDVISAKRNPGDDPLSARLVLNTVRAVSGQWKLELSGDSNVCVGMVYVGKKR